MSGVVFESDSDKLLFEMFSTHRTAMSKMNQDAANQLKETHDYLWHNLPHLNDDYDCENTITVPEGSG